jgi:hypothetical protein
MFSCFGEVAGQWRSAFPVIRMLVGSKAGGGDDSETDCEMEESVVNQAVFHRFRAQC